MCCWAPTDANRGRVVDESGSKRIDRSRLTASKRLTFARSVVRDLLLSVRMACTEVGESRVTVPLTVMVPSSRRAKGVPGFTGVMVVGVAEAKFHSSAWAGEDVGGGVPLLSNDKDPIAGEPGNEDLGDERLLRKS